MEFTPDSSNTKPANNVRNSIGILFSHHPLSKLVMDDPEERQMLSSCLLFVEVKDVRNLILLEYQIATVHFINVLPVHDLGVRRGYQIAYRKRTEPTPEQLDRYSVRWSPQRSTAAWYLWRAADDLTDGNW